MIALLLACAPAATLAPPVPLADGQVAEIGGSITGGGLVPDSDTGCALVAGCAGASGQIYATYTWRERVDLGLMAFGGNTSLFGGGVYGRFWYIDNPRFRLGGELQAGLFWAAAGVPIAGQLHPRVWMYSNPTLGIRYLSLFRVPLGVSVQVTDHLLVSAEFGAAWDPWQVFQSPDGVFLYGSAIVGWRFGLPERE